ncbi:DUF2301 domain-containing membrane protein [Synechocystis sp. PCC 7509]|uniref:DUF2301 domain-containing membrane protein n=1 Tax=Synechocystis sp. PCC 7509 TaxID=927677 RepID=UPI0002AC43A9|nr:DUF2301 domain-containing membrane protein [Synechocystis sp. PCC 7509]
MKAQLAPEAIIYQGQFGDFTIDKSDRISVIIYRTGLAIAALSFALGSAIALLQTNNFSLLTPLFFCFSLGLGVSLLTIHIYLAVLHRVLQIFWAIGTIAAIFWTISSSAPLAVTLYERPVALFGVGFIFAALTGIYFKESFCFHRLETKFLTFLVPVLLLGHMLGIFPQQLEQIMLATWATLFGVFAVRKVVQPIPPDIGDKSVFTYLHERSA